MKEELLEIRKFSLRSGESAHLIGKSNLVIIVLSGEGKMIGVNKKSFFNLSRLSPTIINNIEDDGDYVIFNQDPREIEFEFLLFKLEKNLSD